MLMENRKQICENQIRLISKWHARELCLLERNMLYCLSSSRANWINIKQQRTWFSTMIFAFSQDIINGVCLHHHNKKTMWECDKSLSLSRKFPWLTEDKCPNTEHMVKKWNSIAYYNLHTVCFLSLRTFCIWVFLIFLGRKLIFTLWR